MAKKSSKITNKSSAASSGPVSVATPSTAPTPAPTPAPMPVPFPLPSPAPVPPPVPSGYLSSAFTYLNASSSSAASPHRGAAAAPPSVRPGHFVGVSSSPPLLIPPGVSRDFYRDSLARSVQKSILDLTVEDRRGDALAELCKQKRRVFQDLAPYVWFSFGTVVILLEEVFSIYPFLSPPRLTQAQSYRVGNVLVLLQCVASHPATRISFLKAQMPYYICVFLNTIDESLSRPFEYVRLTTLEVIAALMEVQDAKVIDFLLSSEIMPLCLRTMQRGSKMSRIVSASIVEKYLLNDACFQHVCNLPEQLFSVFQALGNVVASLAEAPSPRQLKHVIRCYHRFLDDGRSLWALRKSFPKVLTDGTFRHFLREDQLARMWLQQLLDNVRGPPVNQLDRLSKAITRSRYRDCAQFLFLWVAVNAVLFRVLNQCVDVEGMRTHMFVIAEDKTLDLHPNITAAY